MYLIDTNVLSESRKGARADTGVRQFFADAARAQSQLYLSVVTIGELRRGIELIRHRGDHRQAKTLQRWFTVVVDEYADCILDVDTDVAQIWGRLRAPNPHNALDKLIAATALLHDLTVVSRNAKDFQGTGVRLVNPFHALSRGHEG